MTAAPQAASSLDLARLPDSCVVLLGRGCPLSAACFPGARLLWSNRSYQLWKAPDHARLGALR
jgi:hypothetical protein